MPNPNNRRGGEKFASIKQITIITTETGRKIHMSQLITHVANNYTNYVRRGRKYTNNYNNSNKNNRRGRKFKT